MHDKFLKNLSDHPCSSFLANPKIGLEKESLRVDKNGTIHVAIGKVSFSSDKIFQNAKEVLDNILKIKPSSSKGIYMKSIFMSSTMSPGIKIDTNSF